MPFSADDLISQINEEVSRLTPVGNAVAVARHSALLHLRDVLRRTGFPTDSKQRHELSLVPLVFQEANYDDIDWTHRAAPLGHLSGIFAIDVAVQSAGRERHELTDAEYKEYVDGSFAAIDYRTKRH
ncbi:MAG: hypothetical protein O6929_14455 [candidate division NC10 bacterium]|nr:hypothetical protein [candidate division NC10 bacterium]